MKMTYKCIDCAFFEDTCEDIGRAYGRCWELGKKIKRFSESCDSFEYWEYADFCVPGGQG